MTRAHLLRRPSLVGLVALALVAVMVTTADAQPSSDAARSALQRAQDRLDDMEAEFNLAVDDYNEAQEALEAAQERVSRTHDEIVELRAEVDVLTDATVQHVRRLHKFGPTVEVATVFGAEGPTAASDKASVLRRVLLGQQASLERLSAGRATLDAKQERLLDQQARAEAIAEDVERKKQQIEEKITEQEDEVAENRRILQSAIDREEAERRAAEAAAAQAAAERRRQQRQQQQQTQPQPTQTSTTPSSPAPAPRGNAQVAVDAALSKLGSPYLWGATGPNRFDCSGLMVWAWAQAGVSLPRTSHSQFTNLRSISRSELQPGDLVFAGSPRVHHVGMYIGNGQIVHSPRSGYTVAVRSMERRDLRGFARVGG